MQIPILLGRDIEERDISGRRNVAVVNELFVKKYFSGQSPIGQHFGLGTTKPPIDLEIVGVAKTARLHSLKQDTPPVVYIPYTQWKTRVARPGCLLLRTAGRSACFGFASARRTLREADARIPVSDISTQASVIDRTISQERTFAMLCSCFAGLAVVIACVGLYGMMAYRVARRTNEIGIRMALGAERGRIIWMVIREVLLIAVAGVGIGVPAALAMSQFVKAYLFQMKPNDPLAIGAAATAMLAAAILAGYCIGGRRGVASKMIIGRVSRSSVTALRDE